MVVTNANMDVNLIKVCVGITLILIIHVETVQKKIPDIFSQSEQYISNIITIIRILLKKKL